MAEPRNCATMLRLEPTFHMIFNKLVEQSGLTAASYLRRLVIEHLQTKGLLSAQMLTRVTTMSPSEIDKIISDSHAELSA